MPLFCHNFVAKSLTDQFLHTIPRKVVTFLCMVSGICSLSMYHTPESEHFSWYGTQKVSSFRGMVRGK